MIFFFHLKFKIWNVHTKKKKIIIKLVNFYTLTHAYQIIEIKFWHVDIKFSLIIVDKVWIVNLVCVYMCLWIYARILEIVNVYGVYIYIYIYIFKYLVTVVATAAAAIM